MMRGPDLHLRADGAIAMLCWAALAGVGGAGLLMTAPEEAEAAPQ
jgi:hypothetical protein